MTSEHRRLFLKAGVAASGSLVLARTSRASAWPSRTIRLIVPFPPAGGTDIVSRLVADSLSTAEQWTFVIENRPGAGGNIGLDLLARAEPDGYTLGMGQTANLAINPSLYRKMPYDSIKDFSPISLVSGQPMVMVVRTEAPYRMLADLVSSAKARAGSVTLASAGNGTVGHLAGELFGQRAHLSFLHVPYKGAGPAATDLMGGQVECYLATPQISIPLIKGGRLRALGVTSLRRVPVLPDVPTFDESGYPGFEASDWKALVAPAGTPVTIVRAVNAAVERMLGRPAILSQLLSEGSVPMGGSVERCAQFIKAEAVRWGDAIHKAGIVID